MNSIKVTKIDETSFEVAVEGRQATNHRVIASAAYVEKLTGGKVTAADLIKHSFEFLLEREPNTSILRRFDLPVIQSYFPEYEAAMRRLTGA